MSKKHFIALAETVKFMQTHSDPQGKFVYVHDLIDDLARFCKSQNGQFNRERWIGYIKGENGPNGGRN